MALSMPLPIRCLRWPASSRVILNLGCTTTVKTHWSHVHEFTDFQNIPTLHWQSAWKTSLWESCGWCADKTGNAEGLSRDNFLEHSFFPSSHRVDGNRSGEERPIKTYTQNTCNTPKPQPHLHAYWQSCLFQSICHLSSCLRRPTQNSTQTSNRGNCGTKHLPHSNQNPPDSTHPTQHKNESNHGAKHLPYGK